MYTDPTGHSNISFASCATEQKLVQQKTNDTVTITSSGVHVQSSAAAAANKRAADEAAKIEAAKKKAADEAAKKKAADEAAKKKAADEAAKKKAADEAAKKKAADEAAKKAKASDKFADAKKKNVGIIDNFAVAYGSGGINYAITATVTNLIIKDPKEDTSGGFPEFFYGYASEVSDNNASILGSNGAKADYISKNDLSKNNASLLLGQQTGKIFKSNDIVLDTSVGISAVTVGYSKVISVGKNFEADYFHAGGGTTKFSMFPVSVSASIGVTKNVNKPEDYAEWFVDYNANLGFGIDYCYWPNGSSAKSLTVSTSPGVQKRHDYYWVIGSK